MPASRWGWGGAGGIGGANGGGAAAGALLFDLALAFEPSVRFAMAWRSSSATAAKISSPTYVGMDDGGGSESDPCSTATHKLVSRASRESSVFC